MNLISFKKGNSQNKKYTFLNLNNEKLINQLGIHSNLILKINSVLTKISNLKINRFTKIALTIYSSSFFLYANA